MDTGRASFQPTLKKRRLDAADILECVLEEDQHCGIHYLGLVLCMSFIIIITYVSADIFHFQQYVTKASKDKNIQLYWNL